MRKKACWLPTKQRTLRERVSNLRFNDNTDFTKLPSVTLKDHAQGRSALSIMLDHFLERENAGEKLNKLKLIITQISIQTNTDFRISDDEYAFDSLCALISENNTDCDQAVKAMLGADYHLLEQQDSLYVLLEHAVEHNNKAILKVLLDLGADPRGYLRFQLYPLFFPLRSFTENEKIKSLLNNGIEAADNRDQGIPLANVVGEQFSALTSRSRDGIALAAKLKNTPGRATTTDMAKSYALMALSLGYAASSGFLILNLTIITCISLPWFILPVLAAISITYTVHRINSSKEADMLIFSVLSMQAVIAIVAFTVATGGSGLILLGCFSLIACAANCWMTSKEIAKDNADAGAADEENNDKTPTILKVFAISLVMAAVALPVVGAVPSIIAATCFMGCAIHAYIRSEFTGKNKGTYRKKERLWKRDPAHSNNESTSAAPL